MRFVTIVYGLGPGGTERTAQNYSEGYKLLGHDVLVFSHDSGGPRVKELSENNIEVLVGGGEGDKKTYNIIDKIVSWDPHVIHIHSHGANDKILRCLFSKLRKKPFVIETNVFSKPSAWLDLIDISFQLSGWCLWLYNCRMGSKTKNHFSAIVPPCVHTQRFNRAVTEDVLYFRKVYGIPNDAVVFGRIGQPFEGKWGYLILDCFSKFLDCSKAYLLLVGLPENMRNHIKRMPMKIRERVIDIAFLKDDKELSDCYSSIDVFLHAANQGESFGMVLAEAQLCETPVITLSTPWGDNSQCEVVENNTGGLITTSRAGFSKAMNLLAKDSKLREDLGKQGRNRISCLYDVIPVTQKIISICKLGLHDREKLIDKQNLTDNGIKSTISADELSNIYTHTYDGHSAIVKHMLLLRNYMPRLFVDKGWSLLTRLCSGFPLYI